MAPEIHRNFEDLDFRNNPLTTTQRQPTTSLSSGKVWVKSISFFKDELKFSYQQQQNNRVVQSLEKEKFLVADFSKLRFDNWKITTDYIIRILTNGVIINNETYNYLGQSNSHLKDRKCLMYRADQQEIKQILDRFGDWSNFNNVAKLSKRIGLLFSSGEKAFDLSPEKNEIIEDVERFGHCFTDGCGFASKDILKKVAKNLGIDFRKNRYVPSVIQIRYQGFKGILLLGTHLSGMSCQFRRSMNKFKYKGPNDFFVVGNSKPYTFGRLNSQIIILISSLGVPDDVLVKKQAQHFERLKKMFTDLSIAFEYLLTIGELDLASELIESGFTEKVLKELRENYKKELRTSVKEKKPKSEGSDPKGKKPESEEPDPKEKTPPEEKIRIIVQDSRLVYAASDPTGKLGPDECFFRPTIQNKPTTITGPVFCVRNPCYHAGDIVVLNAVHLPGCEDIIDAVLFSVNGEVPTAHRSAGGDLDGDKFFVCWDPELMPREMVESYSYPAAKQKRPQKIQRSDIIKHFVSQSNSSVALCAKLFIKWAEVNGPRCNECFQINKLFSDAVDGQSVDIADYLKQVPPVVESIKNNKIWNKLVTIAEEYRSNDCTLKDNEKKPNPLRMNREELYTFLEENGYEATDYEMLNILIRWCRANQTDADIKDSEEFQELLYYLDFSSFNTYERISAINMVPRHLLFNALHMSRILEPTQIDYFKLGEEKYHWKLFHSSESGRNGNDEISFSANLVSDLVKAVTNFRRVYVVLRFDHELTFCISFHGNFMPDSENDADNKIIVYGFNQSGRIMKKKSCLNDYKLFYSKSHFQIYVSHIRNTFIWLGVPKKLGGRVTSLNELTTESRVSIAIDKLCSQTARVSSRITKKVITESEIYVVSNREGILTRYQVVNPDYVADMEEVDIDADYNPPNPLNPKNEQDKELLLLSPITSPTYELKELKKRIECWAEYGVYDKIIKSIHMYLKVKDKLSDIEELVNFSTRYPNVHGPLTSFVIRSCPADFHGALLIRMIGTCMKAVNSSKESVVMENVMNLINCPVALSMLQVIQLVNEFIINYPDSKMALEYLEELFFLLEKKQEDAASLIAVTYFMRQIKLLCIQTLEEFSNKKEKPLPNRYKALKSKAGMKRYSLISTGSASVRVRPGDILLLKRLNSKSVEPVSMIRAVVISTDREMFVDVSWVPRDIEKATWKVKNIGNYIGFRQSIDAMEKLYPTQEEEISIILKSLLEPQKFSNATDNDLLEADIQELNLSQRKAVVEAEKGILTLWQGPAGTGKTNSIYRLILRLLSHDPSKPILVTAATNAAVDNIARLLVRHGDIKTVRIGDINSILPELHHITLEAGLEGTSRRINSKKSEEILKEAKVICATCVGCGASLLDKPAPEFEFVIVDEASQVSEPICLIPLAKKCERFVLVGDHKQLRPFCLPMAEEAGYNISMFERMYNISYLLDTQYRMHPKISEFPNEYFYDGKLFDGIGDVDRPKVDGFMWPRDDVPVAFVQVPGKEEPLNKSTYNQAEVDRIFDVVKVIVESGMNPQDIGIISLYSAQLEKMKESLKSDASVRDIEVKTADGFQGREKELILITCVRCNDIGEIGFLKDEHRFNVMLTRAKRGLIVFGNRETLCINAMWQNWFLWIDKYKLEIKNN